MSNYIQSNLPIAAPTAASDTMIIDAFYGPLNAHLGTQNLPNTTSDRSLSSMSSALVTTDTAPEEKIRKADLAEHDKINLERAFDLLVEDIILDPRLGWDNSTIDLKAKECLNQASAENEEFPGSSSCLFL